MQSETAATSAAAAIPAAVAAVAAAAANVGPGLRPPGQIKKAQNASPVGSQQFIMVKLTGIGARWIVFTCMFIYIDSSAPLYTQRYRESSRHEDNRRKN